MVKLNEAGYPTKLKIVQEPILGVVYESNDSFTDVIYDSEVWTVPTYKLNKGGNHVGEINRSL